MFGPLVLVGSDRTCSKVEEPIASFLNYAPLL